MYLTIFPFIDKYTLIYSFWSLEYSPPRGVRSQLDPEDEELLREDVTLTPVKKDGLKRKERPTDQGFSWLVKTQYISPLSTDATKQVTSNGILIYLTSAILSNYVKSLSAFVKYLFAGFD